MARWVETQDADATRRNAVQTEQHPNSGRLARAVGSQESVDPPALDAQIEAVHGREPTEALHQPGDVDGHGLAHVALASSSIATIASPTTRARRRSSSERVLT